MRSTNVAHLIPSCRPLTTTFDHVAGLAVEVQNDRKQPDDHVDKPAIQPATFARDRRHRESVEIAEAEDAQHRRSPHDEAVLKVVRFLLVVRHGAEPEDHGDAADDQSEAVDDADGAIAVLFGTVVPQPVGAFAEVNRHRNGGQGKNGKERDDAHEFSSV